MWFSQVPRESGLQPGEDHGWSSISLSRYIQVRPSAMHQSGSAESAPLSDWPLGPYYGQLNRNDGILCSDESSEGIDLESGTWKSRLEVMSLQQRLLCECLFSEYVEDSA